MQLAADPQGEFEVPLPPERAAAVREQVPYSKPRYTYYASTDYGRCEPRAAGHGCTEPLY